MKCLYCTADNIGTETGAGAVTWNELESLKQIGETTLIDSKFFQQFAYGQPEPYLYDYLADAHALHDKIVPDLACFYAGTFSKAIMRMKQLNVPVSYGCDAHDPEVSRDEFIRSGFEFNIPHLANPMLWASYVEGYLRADLVTCPSTASERILRRFGCKNVVVIPHGVHLPLYVTPAPSDFAVGYFGQVGPDKGIRYLLRAWKKLDWPDVRLKFGGRGSELLEQAVKDLKNAEIVGPVDFVSDFFNAISVYVQPSACLLPGSLVFGNDIVRPIESIRQNIVIGGDGKFHEAVKFLKRYYEGEVISVVATGINEPVTMTAEHKVLCLRRNLESRTRQREDDYNRKLKQWVEAWDMHRKGLGSVKISRVLGISELMVRSWLYYGTKPRRLSNQKMDLSLREVVKSGGKLEWIRAGELEIGDIVVFPRVLENSDIKSLKIPERVGPPSHNAKILPPHIELNKEALRLLGYYIAEGCTCKDGVAFCLHAKETDYANDIASALSNFFGLESKIKIKGNKLVLRVYSAECGRFLGNLCGGDSHHKTMPSWALALPMGKLRSLLRGMWRGDGSVFVIRRGMTLRGSYTTVSRVLAYQLFAALVKLGYMPKLYRNKRGYQVVVGNDVEKFAKEVDGHTPPKHRKYKIQMRTFIDNSYYYMPVSKISRLTYRGDVFNLEVEGEHSYLSPFVVHNSEGYGIEVLEAMAHGRPVIVSDGAGAADAVTEGVDGFVVPAMDSDAVADRLDKIRSLSASDIQQMGVAARKKAEQYTWDKIRPMYVNTWKKLLKT